MKANELRIGNYVKINNAILPETENRIYKISGVNLRFDISFPDSDSVISLDCIKTILTYNQFSEYIEPIPLTEEWLLKFGFYKLHYEVAKPPQYRLGNRLIVLRDGVFCDYGTGRKLEYVHVFQNLCFILEEKELQLVNEK